MSPFELLDYIGTAVFAISGALAAMRRKFDPFGVLILASVTAIGGGSLRDILVGNTPVGWMIHWNYLIIIFCATLVAMLFRTYLSYFRKTMFLFDAIGLGIFTIIGVEIGLNADLHPIICIILGTLSASFGGVLRDILCNEVPLIFHKEVYASLSIIGGIVFYGLLQTSLSININYVITSCLVVTLRVLAVRFRWILPKIYKEI
ncbi:MAG: trimeric intracellular cation channel family protein [Flavobacteriaceae bacterium]|nr:trimeric intracellular cation channel family protein [Flavobacteriaceae bacterium]